MCIFKLDVCKECNIKNGKYPHNIVLAVQMQKLIGKLNLEGFLGDIHLLESKHFRRMQVVC